MKNIVLLLICFLSVSCYKASNITGNDKVEYSTSVNSLKVITDVDIIGEIGSKTYASQELKNGIEKVEYGTEVVLKSIDNNYYEWIFDDWKNLGEVPHYDSGITFSINRDLVIIVKE